MKPMIPSTLSIALLAGLMASAALACGQTPADPLYRSKGDHERTYRFVEAGIDSPYRLYVPEGWDGKRRLPLVVILHGSNLDHDAPFDREPAELKGILKREADKHGFLVVAPEGYKGGSYGNTYPAALIQYLHPGRGAPRGAHRPDRPAGEELQPAGPMPSGPASPAAQSAAASPASPQHADATAPELNRPGGFGPAVSPEERARQNRLAEQDVLNVIGLVQKEYKTDPARLYLMGNSMGAIGTFSLAAAYPKMFTALGPSDGPIDPTFYPYANVKGIGGVIVVHGEDDNVAPIDDSEVMAFLFKQQGIDCVFDPVAKGGHGNSWYIELPRIFDFYDAHSMRADAGTR